jgi:hypothetical protein
MKLYRYKVSGSGVFPLDMLRYDMCWPRDSLSVDQITDHQPQAIVELSGVQPPTVPRWESFGWRVGDVKPFSF